MQTRAKERLRMVMNELQGNRIADLKDVSVDPSINFHDYGPEKEFYSYIGKPSYLSCRMSVGIPTFKLETFLL